MIKRPLFNMKGDSMVGAFSFKSQAVTFGLHTPLSIQPATTRAKLKKIQSFLFIVINENG